jgi:predicted lipid carrier protein YhbT
LADRKARWLVRWVEGASDARLESAMRGPLRAILLWQIFTTMCQRVDAVREPGLDVIIEFRIRRARSRNVDRCRIAIADGRCTTTRRGERNPTVALELDGVSFLRLVGGAAAPAGLLFRGRLKLRGDLLLGARLPRMLNIPRPSGPRRARG